MDSPHSPTQSSGPSSPTSCKSSKARQSTPEVSVSEFNISAMISRAISGLISPESEI